MPVLIYLSIAFGFGLCFGSFANVLIHRIPRKISLVSPGSACRACGSPVSFYDLIPVINWILLKGRCRHCKKSISLRYPLIEITCGLLFTGMAIVTPSLSAIFLSLFAFVLLVISIIDFDTQEIPDGLLIFAAIIGVCWVVLGHYSPYFPMAPGFIDAGLGILAGGLPLLLLDKLVLVLYKKDGFGYGDVKLMAVCGMFLGWRFTFVAFFFAFVTGGIYATVLLITGHAKRGEYIAFGPFLCAGVVAAIWLGQVFLSLFM